MSAKKNSNPAKETSEGKIRAQLARFIEWLAEGQKRNSPCAG